MPENRAHADTGGRIAAGSERNRRAVEWNRNRKTVNSFTERSTVNRLLIVACLSLLWMTVVFGRLGYLQLFLHTEYMARAQRQQQRVIEITPKRGAIRSEERRVGKECRSRGSAYHEKKKREPSETARVFEFGRRGQGLIRGSWARKLARVMGEMF